MLKLNFFINFCVVLLLFFRTSAYMNSSACFETRIRNKLSKSGADPENIDFCANDIKCQAERGINY